MLGAIPRIRAICRKLRPCPLRRLSSSRSRLVRGRPRMACRKIQNLLGTSRIAKKIFLPPRHTRLRGGGSIWPPPPRLLCASIAKSPALRQPTAKVGRSWVKLCSVPQRILPRGDFWTQTATHPQPGTVQVCNVLKTRPRSHRSSQRLLESTPPSISANNPSRLCRWRSIQRSNSFTRTSTLPSIRKRSEWGTWAWSHRLLHEL